MSDLFTAGVSACPMQDSKRIVREWNREIEAENRRLTTARNEGWGKIVVWALLEVMWLVAVFAVLGLVGRLY
jgi:hypothetical protein